MLSRSLGIAIFCWNIQGHETGDISPGGVIRPWAAGLRRGAVGQGAFGLRKGTEYLDYGRKALPCASTR